MLSLQVAITSMGTPSPEVTEYFAEFLNEGSLDRLGILYPSTSVGLRYGHLNFNLEAFLGSVAQSLSLRGTAITPQLRLRIYLQVSTPTRLAPALQSAG
jgi:hypothetical protein